MEQKLLFFDIDGTLITEGDGKLPFSTAQALKKAKEQGHLLFINTGRTKTSLPPLVLELGFDGYVCGCGTHIFFREEELLCSRLDNDFCRQIVKKIREYPVPVLYESTEAIYFDYSLPNSEEWVKRAESIFGVTGTDIEEIFHNEEKVYDKLLVFLKPTEENEKLKTYLSQYFTCIDRGHDMYEVVQKGYSKGTGIHYLCERLGKNIQDCYVFGDSENDRAMLEAVPNSIAMGNSQESVKKICSYITADIEEDGIYKAMEHFGLI